MKKPTLILLLIMTFSSSTNGQTLEWTINMGGAKSESGNAITIDLNGDIIITGIFQGIANFNPNGPGYNLTSKGLSDIFIQKVDANGKLLWAKAIGGKGVEISESIAVDKNNNIYITGYFEQTVDFDPNVGTFSITAAGRYDIFILKLDAAGNMLWVKSMGGPKHDFGLSITIDPFGNIITTGIFQEKVDFDPNAGIYNLYSYFNSGDIFIQK